MDGNTGTVLSIDLLSIKIRTYDNLFIRIPNQKVISSEITNLTRFPIRRIDIPVKVAYKDDLEKVKEILKKSAKQNPYCLMNLSRLLSFRNLEKAELKLLWESGLNVPMLDPAKTH